MTCMQKAKGRERKLLLAFFQAEVTSPPRHHDITHHTLVVTQLLLQVTRGQGRVEGHSHAHRAHSGLIPSLQSVPGQQLLQEAQAVQQPGECQQQLLTAPGAIGREPLELRAAVAVVPQRRLHKPHLGT